MGYWNKHWVRVATMPERRVVMTVQEVIGS